MSLNLGGRFVRSGGLALGPGGNCVCKSCGYEEPHGTGSPCFLRKCPSCGKRMTRN